MVHMVHLHHDNIANRILIDQLLVPSTLYIQSTKILKLSNIQNNVEKKFFTLLSIGLDEKTLNNDSNVTSFFPLACIHLIHGVKRSSKKGGFFQLS